MERLYGINPVEAALASERRQVDRLWIQRGRGGSRLDRLKDLARRRGVRIEVVDRERLGRLAGGSTRADHQGVVASVSPLAYAEPDELLEACGREARLLVLDGVEDPRNLGAILRTAAGAGVAGVFLPRRGAVGLTASVLKAAAGTAELVPVAQVGNVASFVKSLKEKGFWTIGLEAAGDRLWDGTRYPARMALVVGGEGRGLRRLVRERCDEIVSIPLALGVESLNLTVATGICLYEAIRQERGAKTAPKSFT